MSKTFLAIIAAIVVIFGGILLFKGDESGTVDSGNAKPTSHVVGEGTAGVTLVEYGDFQCPYCGQYYPVVETVKAKYKDQLTFQFRNLPLQEIHRNAFAAARAAEAASLQGKFWEMYDVLFRSQSAWSESNNARSLFDEYARQLQLDVAKFKTDYASSAVNDTINADIGEFMKTKEAKSTPTFFLNGKKITPVLDPNKTLEENAATFSKLIDDAIAEKAKQ